MRLRTHSAAALALAMSLISVPIMGAAAGEAPVQAGQLADSEQAVAASGALVSAEQFEEIQGRLSELIDDSAAEPLLDEGRIAAIAGSPAGPALAELVIAYVEDPAVPAALNAVVLGLQDPPPGYPGNPWKAASDGADLLRLMVDDFLAWAIFLPEIDGAEDNGLYYIQKLAWFYYHNDAGQDFVQGRDPLSDEPLEVGRKFLADFSDQRGEFLWSPASAAMVEQWVSDPRIEIGDYQKNKAGDYDSWNDFFAREIIIDEVAQTIPSRPATMPLSEYPERDYIVVSPTDCIINPLVQVLVDDAKVVRRLIDNPLQHDTVLDVKGIPLSIDQLLGNLDDELKAKFVGGSGLACVLMPNTYHHFHAPVNGTVVHAEVLDKEHTFGYYDWPNWVPLGGNVGRPGTDFSQFQVFERGVIVIEVQYQDVDGELLTGYVASIPVGLDTVGSVVLDEQVQEGLVVKRGYTRLGNFYYGGSLDILLFSKGLASGVVQTRLGSQIAILEVGDSPDVN